MRKLLAFFGVVLAVIILPLPILAQNLVPNPGFEKLNVCPVGGGAIMYDPAYSSFPYVDKWTNPLYQTSPDVFNVCASPLSGVHVPESYWGFQKPHTGSGFAGIIGWQGDATNTDDWREYLQCKLLQPLVAGQRYCVTYYVNDAISTTPGFDYFNFAAIEEVGINFSVTKPSQASGKRLALPAQVLNTTGYISDTAAWKKISAVYTATGNEEWMTVGCFYNGGVPNHVLLYPSTPNANQYRAYLYFDDFSVVPITAGDTVKHSYDSLVCKRSGFTMTLGTDVAENAVWNNGATTPTLDVTAPGTYWCSAAYNCQYHIDTFHVVFDPNKVLSAGNDTGDCENNPVILKTNSGFSNRLWSTGDTSQSIVINKSGVYYVSGINECGLQHDTVNVYIQPPTDPPAVTDTTVCQFTPGPDLGITGTDINWYTHPKGIFGFPNQPVITTSEPGTFTFYVSQTIGKCESERVPVVINVRYTPHEELPDLQKMCENIPDTIGVQHDGVSYKWTTGEMSCCIVPHHEGNYKVATSNECGSYIENVHVDFSICEDCIAVPNAFVPYHSETGNNYFKAIITCPVKGFHIRIFNRWGNMVYNSEDPSEGWNGYYNNIACDQGVYVYMIEYRSVSTGNPRLLKGNFTLLK